MVAASDIRQDAGRALRHLSHNGPVISARRGGLLPQNRWGLPDKRLD
ncbi:hypothetical protein [Azospirillum palustre]